MDKRLRRMFSQVKLDPEREDAMLADLLSGKNEDASAPRGIRRMPRAALIAAVLVFVLAGTALAAYFGQVRIEEADQTGRGKWDGSYYAYASDCVIPLDSLSAEVRNAFPDSTEHSNYISFKSWADAEAFLGLELADNIRLDQMAKSKRIQYKPGGDSKLKKAHSHCLMRVNLPWTISISAYYETTGCVIIEDALIKTDFETDYETGDPSLQSGWKISYQGDVDFSEYTTPGGLKVSICKGVTSYGNHKRTTYNAYFVKNNAIFRLEVLANQVWNIEQQVYEFLDPWDTLIEILDAYE